ncbi:MAG: hypothetical protein WAW39_10040 [Prosthecobacter sp.]|uniref:hypothetical protein n=1 Tax=Prosthecobacter sp. TaxID=1965333 RepID=UPI003BB01DD3
MSANNYLPHLLVLPEDDANRQILVGFRNHHAVNFRKMDVQNIAGGWLVAVKLVKDEHVPLMRKFPKRHVLLVIDFDGHSERRDQILSEIPAELKSRFYILSCSDEPEALLASLASTGIRAEEGSKLETLGKRLATDCDQNTNETWGHDMLAHNATELERLKTNVKDFLFS